MMLVLGFSVLGMTILQEKSQIWCPSFIRNATKPRVFHLIQLLGVTNQALPILTS